VRLEVLGERFHGGAVTAGGGEQDARVIDLASSLLTNSDRATRHGATSPNAAVNSSCSTVALPSALSDHEQ
jgi:hypothetical protein